MAQKQARSFETTNSIMRAAMKLGMARGIETVTIREICAEAGVSVGAFYHHFSSREELFARAHEAFDMELNRRMAGIVEGKPPMEAFRDLLMFQVTFISQEGRGMINHYYRTILNMPSLNAVSPNRSYYCAAYACAARLEEAGLLRPEYAADRIAELCISFVRGCLIDWCLHEQQYDVVARVRQLLPILFRGFVKENVEID